MKKFILAGLLYVSTLWILALAMVGMIHTCVLHHWNLVHGIIGLCVPLAYIVALAMTGLLDS